MRNKKLVHFERLLTICRGIQIDLLAQKRSLQNDLIIVTLFDLVAKYPLLPEVALHDAYDYLRSTLQKTEEHVSHQS
ncbi:MAG: hypothetical protein AAF149_06955 [Bacteroidota bacterium]